MKRLCWLVGHTEVFNDSGYSVCSCGTHEYWDHIDWNRAGIIYIPLHFYRRVEWNLKDFLGKYFQRCYDCGEFEIFFGRKVGDHTACIPF